MRERTIPDYTIFINKSSGKIHGIISNYKYRPYKLLPIQEITEDAVQ